MRLVAAEARQPDGKFAFNLGSRSRLPRIICQSCANSGSKGGKRATKHWSILFPAPECPRHGTNVDVGGKLAQNFRKFPPKKSLDPNLDGVVELLAVYLK